MTSTEIKSNLAAIAYVLETLDNDENFINIRSEEEFDGGATLSEAIAIIKNLQNSLECWQAI